MLTGMVTFFIGLTIAIAIRRLIDNNHEDTDSQFKQRNVIVNYIDKTVTIKKQVFSLEQIRRSWVDGIFACFEVEDINKPIRKIRFENTNEANTFISRFEIAYNKANQAQS